MEPLVEVTELDALSVQVVEEYHADIGSPVHSADELLVVAPNQLQIVN